MQFFQVLTGVAVVAGCSANLMQWNSQRLDNPNKIIGFSQMDAGNRFGISQLDAGNKLIGLQQFDTGNKLIGLSQLDAGNKLIGLQQFDTGNKLIGLSQFDTGNRHIGLQSFASQPAHMHIGTARGFRVANAGLSNFALGGVTPLAMDNSALLYNNAANVGAVRLVNTSPAITNFGARTIGLAQSSPSMIVSGRSADQIISTSSADVKPVTAAVATLSRTVDYAPMGYSGEPPKTQVVNVPPNEQGLHINFFSKSSPLTVAQQHIPGEAGQVHVTESEDEPHRLVHNVKKSVVQEVNESIQPFRILKQEVKPVIERAHTVVAEGNNIPLSGRASGIIATEAVHQQQPSMALLHARPTQVITAQEPVGRSLKFSTMNVAENLQPVGLNMATISQPAAFASGFGLQKVAIAQPRSLDFATVHQPSTIGLQRVAINQPASFASGFGLGKATGSMMFADASPAWSYGQNRHMVVQQHQPSMLIQKSVGMPMGHTSAINTQFFNKPAQFTTGHVKIQRF